MSTEARATVYRSHVFRHTKKCVCSARVASSQCAEDWAVQIVVKRRRVRHLLSHVCSHKYGVLASMLAELAVPVTADMRAAPV